MEPNWALIVQKLKAILGEERVTDDPLDLLCYSKDASIETGTPNVIVFPETPHEVVEIVNLAYVEAVPVIPRGAGSNVSGGAIATERGGIVVCLTRMNKILELDAANFQVLVEPGVICLQLNEYLNTYGLYFPPDPASDKTATIGGMINENSGGIRAVRYGVTREWIVQLQVVLPDGRVIWTGNKARKAVAGYDLTRLFIGSEGTLGIVTKAWLRLTPLPEIRLLASGYFNTPTEAGHCVYTIMRKRLDPSGAEILDSTTLQAVSEFSGRSFPECGAIVIVELDGNKQDVELRLDTLEQIFREEGAIKIEIARNPSQYEHVWRARKAAFPALTVRRPTARMEDISIPISQLPRMFEELERISKQFNVEIATFGHSGDGNLHPIVLWDERIPKEHENALNAINDVWSTALTLGGTVSGEHGIGLSKLKMMEKEFGKDALDVMRAIKHALDPKGIMNPGKVIPL
ncbi:MAG: FAD-binding oxidoreductase [Candidatus Heimdallarchaeota archaeon]